MTFRNFAGVIGRASRGQKFSPNPRCFILQEANLPNKRLEMKKYGAIPPASAQWQIGKTAASISFVQEAERYIGSCKNRKETARLKKEIRAIKNGTRVLNDWMTVEQFLAS